MLRNICIVVSAALITSASYAQTDNSRAIKLVVPYGAGGGTDILARNLATKLAEHLGQPVIVENKGGAGSRIGTEQVVRARPDGLNVLITDTAITTNPSLYRKMPYDASKQLSPVSLLASAPTILVVHPSVKVNTIKEFIELGKKSPLQMATAGPGAAPSLATDLLSQDVGLKVEVIPYKGVGPAIVDVVSGQVPMMFTGISSAKQLVQAGRLKAIAVTGDERSSSMPNVPTFAESGLKAVDAMSYWGALVPAGTDKAVIDRLSAAFAKVIKLPEIQESLRQLGYNPIGSTPDAFAKNLESETTRWASVIKKSGVELAD